MTHAAFPLRDPVFLAILALELVVLIAGTSDGYCISLRGGSSLMID